LRCLFLGDPKCTVCFVHPCLLTVQPWLYEPPIFQPLFNFHHPSFTLTGKMDYQRFVVIGKSGSGKSTLATRLSKLLSLDNVELDALAWEPNWTQAPREVMRERVTKSTPVDGKWVVDGNYKNSRDITWSRAEVLIWLDYSLLFTMWRLIRRTFGRIFYKTELWNGNREHISNHLVLDPVENLFLNAIRTHWAHRRDFPLAIQQPEFQHLKVLRFRRSEELETWIKSLSGTGEQKEE
jgi:adenylate kinase family enzyme